MKVITPVTLLNRPMQAVQLSQTELDTLDRAVGILDELRRYWSNDHPADVDVATAADTMRNLVGGQGRVELPAGFNGVRHGDHGRTVPPKL